MFILFIFIFLLFALLKWQRSACHIFFKKVIWSATCRLLCALALGLYGGHPYLVSGHCDQWLQVKFFSGALWTCTTSSQEMKLLDDSLAENILSACAHRAKRNLIRKTKKIAMPKNGPKILERGRYWLLIRKERLPWSCKHRFFPKVKDACVHAEACNYSPGQIHDWCSKDKSDDLAMLWPIFINLRVLSSR